MIPEPNVVHVLCVAEDAEELHSVSAPARSVAGQLLHHQDGALTAAQRDGLSNLGAGIIDRRSDSLHRLIADQVANIRNNPRGAGLNKLIVIELIEILGQDGKLFLNHHQQRLQRPTGGFGLELSE